MGSGTNCKGQGLERDVPFFMLTLTPTLNDLEIDKVISGSSDQKTRDELTLTNKDVGQTEISPSVRTLRVKAVSNVRLLATRSLPIGCGANIS